MVIADLPMNADVTMVMYWTNIINTTVRHDVRSHAEMANVSRRRNVIATKDILLQVELADQFAVNLAVMVHVSPQKNANVSRDTKNQAITCASLTAPVDVLMAHALLQKPASA